MHLLEVLLCISALFLFIFIFLLLSYITIGPNILFYDHFFYYISELLTFLSKEKDPFFFISWISSLCVDACLKIVWWKAWSLKFISVCFDFLSFLFVSKHDMHSYSCSRPFGFWITGYFRIFRSTNHHFYSCHIVLSCFDFLFFLIFLFMH